MASSFHHEEELAQLIYDLQHVHQGAARRFSGTPVNIDQFAAARDEILNEDFDRCVDITDEMIARCAWAIKEYPQCQHLDVTPAQPAYARLASGKVVCKACLDANMAPLPDQEYADHCNWCGDNDVNEVWPITVGLAHYLYEGDACYPCCIALGVEPEMLGRFN